jgi:hypothetical protein
MTRSRHALVDGWRGVRWQELLPFGGLAVLGVTWAVPVVAHRVSEPFGTLVPRSASPSR